MNMVEVRTAELSGRALDWAVLIAEGWEPDRPQDGQLRREVNGSPEYCLARQWSCDSEVSAEMCNSPSTDWAQGGPLRDRHKVAVYDVERGMIAASLRGNEPEMWIDEGEFEADAVGATALIAICRAIVAAKLGDVVQVPAELVQEARHA